MTLLQQVVATVYTLAIAGKWDDLREYIALVRTLLSTPTMTLIPGKITDKEIKK